MNMIDTSLESIRKLWSGMFPSKRMLQFDRTHSIVLLLWEESSSHFTKMILKLFRSQQWLKIKQTKKQNVVIAGGSLCKTVETADVWLSRKNANSLIFQVLLQVVLNKH